jgi:hypothetical protein
MVGIMGLCAIHFSLAPHTAPIEHLKFFEIFFGLIALVLLTPIAWRLLDRLAPSTALCVVLVIAASVRVMWVVQVPNEPVSDFAVYQELANAIASGKGYTLTGPAAQEDLDLYLGTDKQFPYTTAYRAPGTALWGALLIKLSGHSVALFKAFNIFFSVGIGFLLYIMIRPMNAPLALRAAWLWALYPPAAMATDLFGSETLFCFFSVLLACLVVAIPNHHRYKIPLLGFLTAWTALIRSMLWVLVASLCAVMVLENPRKETVRRLFLYVICVALGLSPWMVRNWRLFHHLVPVCTGEGEFLGRHSAYLLTDNLQDLGRDPSYAAWRSVHDEWTRSAMGYRRAVHNWTLILKSGFPSTLNALRRSADSAYRTDDEMLFWSVTRSYRGVNASLSPAALDYTTIQHWRWISQAYYLFILVGAWIGLWIMTSAELRKFRWMHVLAANFALFFMANSVGLSKPRYHFAMMPLLMMLAAYGYSALLSRRTHSPAGSVGLPQ